MARPPRIPMLLPLDQTVTCFITICVANRRPTLNNPEVFGAILKFCDPHEQWQTLAAVVMPDHMHAFVRPLASRDAKVTQYSAGLKRFVRRETKAAWKWQNGVFDRLLRRNEFAESKWIYMRENPVRAGLVIRWEDWPYAIGYHM
jgi:REP-associated tyrosine transposase